MRRIWPGWRRWWPSWSGVDAPLSESLALFEEGAKLVSQCRKELDAAEQKVVKLAKGADGAPVESDFTAEE